MDPNYNMIVQFNDGNRMNVNSIFGAPMIINGIERDVLTFEIHPESIMLETARALFTFAPRIARLYTFETDFDDNDNPITKKITIGEGYTILLGAEKITRRLKPIPGIQQPPQYESVYQISVAQMTYDEWINSDFVNPPTFDGWRKDDIEGLRTALGLDNWHIPVPISDYEIEEVVNEAYENSKPTYPPELNLWPKDDISGLKDALGVLTYHTPTSLSDQEVMDLVKYAYENTVLPYKLKPSGGIDKIPPVMYGSKMSDIPLTGHMEYNGELVPGTFKWLTTDKELSYMVRKGRVTWIFTPNDTDTYDTVVRTNTIDLIKG